MTDSPGYLATYLGSLTSGTEYNEVRAALRAIVGATGVEAGDKTDIDAVSTDSWVVKANAITFAKMQQIGTDKLIGRDTAGSGNAEQIGVTGGIEFDGAGNIRSSAFTGDVGKSAGGTVLTISDNSVSNAKLGDMAQGTIKGRAAGSGTGDPSDLNASQMKDILGYTKADIGLANVENLSKAQILTDAALSGTPTAPTPATSDNTTKLATTAWVNAALAGAIGAGVADGDKGDITVSGSGLIWTIDASSVTFAKMQNISTDRLLGRDTTGTGVVEEIGVTGGIAFDGAGNIRLADMANATVKGRNSAGAGAPEDVSMTQLKALLQLNNVDNTYDVNKPVSSAQAAADLVAQSRFVSDDVVSGTTYAVVASDPGKFKRFTSATAVTVTFQTDAAAAFPVNGVISGAQWGAGQVTFVGASGVTLRAPGGRLKTMEQYSGWTAKKVDANEWWVTGDLTS